MLVLKFIYVSKRDPWMVSFHRPRPHAQHIHAQVGSSESSTATVSIWPEVPSGGAPHGDQGEQTLT